MWMLFNFQRNIRTSTRVHNNEFNHVFNINSVLYYGHNEFTLLCYGALQMVFKSLREQVYRIFHSQLRYSIAIL